MKLELGDSVTINKRGRAVKAKDNDHVIGIVRSFPDTTKRVIEVAISLNQSVILELEETFQNIWEEEDKEAQALYEEDDYGNLPTIFD